MARLTLKKVAAGHKFLGCIKQVRDFDLVVALPNRLFGTVPCNFISTRLTDIFTAFASSSEQASAPSLKQFYREGEFVICTVKSAGSDKSGKKRIELSMLPADINIEPEIVEGLVLPGSVVSREDRGWIIDLCSSTAFCKFSEAEDELLPGKTRIFCCTNAKSKVLQVSTSVDKALLRSETIVSLRALLPGNLIDAAVSAVQSTRVIVSLPGSASGCLEFISIDHTESNYSSLKTGERVRLRLTSMSLDGSESLSSTRPSILKLNPVSVPTSHVGDTWAVDCQVCRPYSRDPVFV